MAYTLVETNDEDTLIFGDDLTALKEKHDLKGIIILGVNKDGVTTGMLGLDGQEVVEAMETSLDVVKDSLDIIDEQAKISP